MIDLEAIKLILKKVVTASKKIIVGLLNGNIRIAFQDGYFIYEDKSCKEPISIKIPLSRFFRSAQLSPCTP